MYGFEVGIFLCGGVWFLLVVPWYGSCYGSWCGSFSGFRVET